MTKNKQLRVFWRVNSPKYHLLTSIRIFLLLVTVGLGSGFGNSPKALVGTDVKNAAIAAVPDDALSGTKISDDQEQTISGSVVDDIGDPLLGVSVVRKGTSTGTITDIDGKFAIEAGPSDVLVFSYIGFLTEEVRITAENSTGEFVVKMTNDILQLDELVITGTSALTSKKQLGNAISTIGVEAISNAGSQDITASFSGKLAGALINQNSGNPAGGVSVTLRGASTVFGSSDPLYIIDGIIVDNSSTNLLPLGGYAQNRLVDINPNDIDRIEIIKGAAAAAIYGSRASNGVVQIFTKEGIPGETKISFSTSIKFNQLRKQIYENQEPKKFVSGEPNDPGYNTLKDVTRYNMQDRIFRDAFGTNSNISVRGGSDKTRYFTSASFSNNGGIIRNTDFNRHTLRANIGHQFNNWLNASVYTNYAVSTSHELPNGGRLAPGEFFGVLTGFVFLDTDFNPERQADGTYLAPINFVANPIAAIETYDFQQRTSRFIGGIKIDASPFKNFDMDYTLGYDGSTTSATAFIPVGIIPKVTGWSRNAEKISLLVNNDLNFRYTIDFSDDFTSISSLGLTHQYERTSIFSNTADQLSPSTRSTTGGTIISRTDLREERSIQGAFFQQTFNIYNRLFLTGAIRVDEASTFGEEERTQFYPKASFSYLLSEENFWKNGIGTTIDVLKLRASYGQAGNLTALSAFDRLTNYNPVPFNGNTGFVPDSQLGNVDIKPERQKEMEVGFDLSLFNKVGIEFSYYDVRVEDLLLSRVLAPSSGFSTRLENVGTLTNKGLEVLIRAKAINTTDFSWNIAAIYSKNKNEVNDIEGGQLVLPEIFDQAVVAKNGYPIGVFSGQYFIRNSDGSIKTNAQGLPESSIDRKIIGDPNPDWTGSLINEFRYKKWTFRTQFDAVMGFDIFNWTDRLTARTSLFGGGLRDAQEIRGELPRGYNAAAFNIWERYIEDGSFIKLRELYLAYDIPFKDKAVDNLKISLIGRNLFSLDDYSGWDPEVNSFGQRNGLRGNDFNEVPIPRTIELGLNINF